MQKSSSTCSYPSTRWVLVAFFGCVAYETPVERNAFVFQQLIKDKCCDVAPCNKHDQKGNNAWFHASFESILSFNQELRLCAMTMYLSFPWSSSCTSIQFPFSSMFDHRQIIIHRVSLGENVRLCPLDQRVIYILPLGLTNVSSRWDRLMCQML